ncbi:ATP-dependent nuclease, partial [Holdemanella sp.]|uniref:ATP-dependent nuclease n=1 Tax=Holdemanella sp. TaxID=1971762 RepID=UPI003AEFFF9D
MVVLKRIHIKNFRSIVDATIELDDFNFFVGKNDSGKSNVLKAINLFFNERTDYDTPFNFAVDYSKFAKRSIHQAKEIMIALDVQMPATFKDGGIKTWIKIWRKEGLYSDNATELFSRGTKGTTFLSRIKYMYVPAIKSADYFKYLLSQVYDSMTEVADSALKDLNKKYSSELQEITHGLSENLQNVLHMRSDIQMPRELSTLFKDLSFSTTDKFVKNVDLNQRGDGIKARHIPSILNFMQENMEENRAKNTVSYNFIWGFEEPENGVEYSLCYEMAEELYDYRKKCQLLITTHSPAIYAIKNRDATRCYYVSKKESGATAYDTDISVDEINQKIGLMPLIAPYL